MENQSDGVRLLSLHRYIRYLSRDFKTNQSINSCDIFLSRFYTHVCRYVCVYVSAWVGVDTVLVKFDVGKEKRNIVHETIKKLIRSSDV